MGIVLTATLSFAGLLGVSVAGYPRVTYQTTSTSALTYTASNQLFTITAPPVSIQFSSAETARLISGTKSLSINVLVDNLGNLVGGVPANGGKDFTLSGTVSRIVGSVTNTYSGVLLTGAVTGFGFKENGATDQYDFRFNPTGGALFNLFSCGDIAVQVTSELSTFAGSFLVNFNGRPKGFVALEDVIPPTISCPFSGMNDGLSVTNTQCSAAGGQPGAYVTFPQPTATDNCDTNVMIACSPTNGSFFALSPGERMTTNMVTCTAVDASGNASSCFFAIVVVDTLAPEFVDNSSPVISSCDVQHPVVLNNDTGHCYSTYAFEKPTAIDSCCPTNVPVSISAIDENGFIIPLTEFSSNGISYVTGQFPANCVSSNVITSTAVDSRGNSAQHQCAVFVFDTQLPVITCAGNQTVGCTNGPVFFEEPVASDNCTNLTVSCTPTNGSSLAFGTYTVTCVAIDGCGGNTNSCSFTLSVVDITPPMISCPTNTTVECGQPTDPGSTGAAAATDNCDPNPTVTFADAISGACPTLIYRTWTAVDFSGNTNQCTQVITIRDTTAPVITCPADKQLQCGASTDPSNTGLATATDNCGTNVTVGYTDAATPANCTGKAGIDRTWTATDACGNSSTCVQHITFVDTTAPVATVPTGSNLGCNPTNLPTDVSVKALVTATDNCSTTSVSVAHVDVNTGCVVTRTFTVTATDGCGNASAAQTVVYLWTVDTTAPTVTVPTGSNLGCNPTNLPTDVSVKALVTATDTCSAPVINVSHVDTINGCVVTRTFTVTATDGCGNTSAAQTVAYLWTLDTTAPTVTVPAGSNLGCNPTNLPTDVSVKGLVMATDTCSAPVINVSHVDTINGCVVTRTFTVKATDGCGNTSAAQAVVYTWTADTTPPSITCPGPVTVQCASNVPPANVTSVIAIDACSSVTVSFVGDVITNQTCPNRFTVLRTYRAVDACGNSATCTQTITVIDTTKPSITCPTNITVSALLLCTNAVPATNPTIAAFLHGVTATDNCGGSATVTNNAPSSFPLGTNTVTFTATDSCGNSMTCQAKVIVVLMPVNCEPIQFVPFFCQHHFDGFGRSQFATLEGNITLPNGDQPCDFRSPTGGTFVAVTVTVGTNAPVLVYCKSQNHTVQSDGCGGEAWEYFGNHDYERAIYRFTDNQCYNSLIDPKLPSSSATGNRNCGALSTVSIGATSTRFYYGFQQAKQPITVVCDGIVLLSVSNNVAKSPFPFSQSGKTIQCTFPERLVPGNVVQWYATSDPTKVSSNCLIYTQQTSATGNSTATYYNDGGSCEFQVPTAGLNFNSNDRSVCVQVMIGQPGVSAKVGCFTFCQPLNGMGDRDWQYGQCSNFRDEFDQESDDDWGNGNW